MIIGSVAVLAIMAVATVNVSINTAGENKMSNIVLSSVDILAFGESTASNTGPGKTYDCPGIGTGDGKWCLCSNANPCTETLC